MPVKLHQIFVTNSLINLEKVTLLPFHFFQFYLRTQEQIFHVYFSVGDLSAGSLSLSRHSNRLSSISHMICPCVVLLD